MRKQNNTKPKRKRCKLTDKQRAFVNAYCRPGNGYNNGTQAAVIAGYSARTANHIVNRLLSNVGIKNAIVRVKRDEAAESRFTRELQLQKLEQAFGVAVKEDSPSAMVSAIREQNEMLGYHREHAPNPEREQQQRSIMERELKELARLAGKRTAALSESAVSTRRISSKIVATPIENDDSSATATAVEADDK